ncbi:phage tail protein, partial [Escherichia coli]
MTQTESAILAHARRCVPAESCGFVVRTPEGERYIPCVNISAEPEAYFRIAPEDWLRAEMQGEIVALVHSHPGGLPWLSEADRRLQIKSALPWWLVSRGDIHKFRCVPHLTGRRFEHGVTDCYTLFRDAYHLAGIEMPDFHREDEWWRNGQNLYLDNMEATGFYRVPLSSAQAGDILLCCFGASVANHAAIYCGNGELL